MRTGGPRVQLSGRPWTSTGSIGTFVGVKHNTLRAVFRGLAVLLAGGLTLLGCGDDDSSDASETANGAVVDDSTSDAPDASDVSGDDAAVDAGGGGGLIVPLDYLQGEWCDHEGTTWSIDGETAQLDDGSGGVGEMPINVLFVDVPGALISQDADSFVFMSGPDEVTFTRGAC